MSFLDFFKKKKVDYVFYFSIDIGEIEEKVSLKEKHIEIEIEKKQVQEYIKLEMFNKIKMLLLKEKKDVQFVDLFSDLKNYTNHYIIASEKANKCPYIIPIIYKLFAYIKTSDLNIFDKETKEEIVYKIQDKEIKVLKIKLVYVP